MKYDREAHPMFFVKEAISALSHSVLNAEINPHHQLTNGELEAICKHIALLDDLFNNFQQRIQK